jgi:hypothetical protein
MGVEHVNGVVNIPWTPRIGVVIGTYGSVPLIRLQLEARRRYWPNVPLLIHDDCSPDTDELKHLCEQYDAEYYCTSKRLDSAAGDMAVMLHGLDWAQTRGFDLLVKFSRRFIVYHDWSASLAILAYNTQYPTYSAPCCEYRCGCRSECVAFHVSSWRSSDAVRQMREALEKGTTPTIWMEGWYSSQADRIYQQFAPAMTLIRNSRYPRFAKARGIAEWPIFGFGRQASSPGVLWYNSDFCEDYLALAHVFGFSDLTVEDFRSPDRYKIGDLAHQAQPVFSSWAVPPTDAQVATLAENLSQRGFRNIKNGKAYAVSLRVKPNESSLMSRLTMARLKDKLDISQYDIIRLFRCITAPLYPFMAVKKSVQRLECGCCYE